MPSPDTDFPSTPERKPPLAGAGATLVLRTKTKIAKSASRSKSKGAPIKQANEVAQPETDPPAGCSAWWNF